MNTDLDYSKELDPAMNEEEAISAIEAGIATVQELSGMGYRVIATGEMGIGNPPHLQQFSVLFLEEIQKSQEEVLVFQMRGLAEKRE